MSTWYISGAPSAPPPPAWTRCKVKACPYPNRRESLCAHHLHFFDFQASLTGRHISISDIYNAEDPNRPNLYIHYGKEDCERSIRVVWNGPRQPDLRPYEDKKWGSVFLRVKKEWGHLFVASKPNGPKPNGLCATRVVLPDGSVIATEANKPGTPMANHNATGAFILWKGFGKKKIRKAQRQRPAGWHGNHPEQKPIKVSREALDDIPLWTPPAQEKIKIERENSGWSPDTEEEFRRDQIIAELQHENFEFVGPDFIGPDEDPVTQENGDEK